MVIPKLEGMSHTRAYVDGTVSGLRTSMARAGVDASLVLPVATNPRQVVHVNDSSAQINDLGPETGVYSFGCMHPDFSDYRAELSRVKELGMKGIKLHPVYQGVDFDDIRTLRLLDRAAELGLIVLTHSGLDIGFPGEVRVTPKMVLHAIQEVGPLTLILAHITFNIPYVILSVAPKLRQMNKHTYEAALDLGCHPVGAFFKVVLPEIMPGVMTGMLMAFTLSIDDFVISYFCSGPTSQTLPVLIYSMTRKQVNPKINALSALLFVTVLTLLLIVNIRQMKDKDREEKRRKKQRA